MPKVVYHKVNTLNIPLPGRVTNSGRPFRIKVSDGGGAKFWSTLNANNIRLSQEEQNFVNSILDRMSELRDSEREKDLASIIESEFFTDDDIVEEDVVQ